MLFSFWSRFDVTRAIRRFSSHHRMSDLSLERLLLDRRIISIRIVGICPVLD
ncbi:hypothetical protein PNH38_13920 [Anoxybacillus rupiensis]|uniref:Uncharacterized protein n=1 Tax=Anoxybacteroides rupiense TaxID=311460 RepID=A0ABD5IXT9_9BACL|nr:MULTISPECIES: hypothetical protein [Anoxybacillus]MBS2772254.1 hypothetical protein [Anoxybacillus rupiensis]MDE8564957.1 hypothetical protein [Anoxybacillus rupiensis]MED5052444.1 hypothetical protein [Anoxybacillus rupiensis]QHC05268.1 hypothetical protein GRQ40_15910 [Anoxybacillus sp. PDR2]